MQDEQGPQFIARIKSWIITPQGKETGNKSCGKVEGRAKKVKRKHEQRWYKERNWG